MKRVIIILIVSVISQVCLYAQFHGIDNPICLGIMLIDQPNAEKMKKICEDYDLQEMPMVDGFRVFRNCDDTEFRFRTYNIDDRYYPVVKVYTSKSVKEIEQLLNDTRYVKESNAYYMGSKYAQRRTKCTVSGHSRKTLTFEKEYNELP